MVFEVLVSPAPGETAHRHDAFRPLDEPDLVVSWVRSVSSESLCSMTYEYL